MGQEQWCGGQQGDVLGAALSSKQPHARPQARGRVAGKLPGGRGPGGAGS